MNGTLVVHKPIIKKEKDKTVVCCTITLSKPNSVSKKFIVQNEYYGHTVTTTCIDPFVILLVPLAIINRFEITSDQPIDNLLLQNIQKIPNAWKIYKDHNDYNLVLNLKGIARNKSKKETTLAFTGGIDSFYSFYKKFNKIDSILWIKGFDVNCKNQKLAEIVGKKLRNFALETNKKMLVASSNIRQVLGRISKQGTNWGQYAHAVGIVCVAHGFNDTSKLVLSSSHPYSMTERRASNYMVDGLYTSNQMTIEHFGNQTRLKKLEWLLQNQELQIKKYLRVCFENSLQKIYKYNCSDCEKCLRAMASAKYLGYWDKDWTAFDTTKRPERYFKICDKYIAKNKFLGLFKDQILECKKRWDFLAGLQSKAALITSFKIEKQTLAMLQDETKKIVELHEMFNKGHKGWGALPLVSIDAQISQSSVMHRQNFDKERNAHAHAYRHTKLVTPKMKVFLDSIKAKKNKVRLLQLLPSSKVPTHTDKFVNARILRFHLPIFTNDQTFITIDGQDFQLKCGDLVWTNVRKKHSVRNESIDENRIHLVMDLEYNEWLYNLFQSATPL